MRHVEVYREQGRFCGWPANQGLWSWGGVKANDPFEVVVGFSLAYMKLDVVNTLHRIDRNRPGSTVQARSRDGGDTWILETDKLPPGPPRLFSGRIRFDDPNFGMKSHNSQFYLTYDRAKSWEGPYRLPLSDELGIQARTDYQVLGPKECLVFLTAAKTNGKEGRVYCIHTDDGGANWTFRSWIGPEPVGYSIMPSSLRLPSGRLLCAIRRYEPGEGDTQNCFIELWSSDDVGKTWTFMNEPTTTGQHSGNPPALIRLRDGRLALTYAYRSAPYGIRARVSEDEGVTWSDEIHLRDDGGEADLGYTRTVQRPDGDVITVYYYNVDPMGERFIGGTIWTP